MNQVAQHDLEENGIVEAEIIEEMTEREARQHTDRIKEMLAQFLGLHERIAEQIDIAWNRGAWRSLGYESWDAYCKTEWFGLRSVKIGAQERKEIVASLTHRSRMSSRAQAAALGVHQSTIVRDREELTAVPTPDDATASPASQVPAQTVRGTDGREHQLRSPSYRPRRHLPDALRDATHELKRNITSIESLLNDSRWPANAPELAGEYTTPYLQLADRLQVIAERIVGAQG